MKQYLLVDSDDEALKDLGRKHKGGYKVPALFRNIKEVEKGGHAYSQLVEHWDSPLTPWKLAHPSALKMYPYQREVVTEIATSNHPGSLVFLSPGLGKGIVSIVAAETMGMSPILIICPGTLMQMWVEEIGKWSEYEQKNISIWHSKYNRTLYGGKNASFTNARYVITTYDTMVQDFDMFKGEWDLIIADESLRLKNRKSKRFQAFSKLKFKRLFLLSGNPRSKYNDDLWAQLHLIWPEAFGSYWRFTNEFCIVEKTPWGDVVKRDNKSKDPVAEFPDLIFRRHQEHVLPDLPDIIFRERNVGLTASQAQVHDTLITDWQFEDGEGQHVIIPNKMVLETKLLQSVSCLCNVGGEFALNFESAKHDAIRDMIEDQDIEFPAIIWVHWVPGADWLSRSLRNKGLRVGCTFGPYGEGGIEAYKQGKIDLLFLSLGKGKYGHTLTDTKHMVYLDRIFDADAWVQSLNRVKRIGLKHRPVATILRAEGTVDELVDKNLKGKIEGIARLSDIEVKEALEGILQKRRMFKL